MTLKEFIKKYDGKEIDFDKRYGNQCPDLFNQYLYEVIGITNPIQQFPVMSAYQIFEVAKKNPNFICIENQPTNVPQAGDLIIWGTSIGEHGHCAVFIEGEVMSFKSFDQNWNNVNKCQQVTHSYKGVLGWIRPKRNDYTKELEQVAKPLFDISFLDGHKTKILTAFSIVVAILAQQGYLDNHAVETINLITTALVGYTIRDAIKKK